MNADHGSRDRGGWITVALRRFRELLGVIRADRPLLLFVTALLAVDGFWILYFGVGKMLYELDLDPTLYNHKELMITTDGGIPEWFSYCKTILLVVVLIRLLRTTRQPIYGALTLIVLVVLLDDAMEIHETWGRYFARELDLPRVFKLRPRDLGEVMTWLILAAVAIPMLLFGLIRSGPRDRANGLAFLLPFGALVFCAIVVDQLYGNFKNVFVGAGVLLDMIEDGGEMLAITVMCALALAAERESEPTRAANAPR